MRSARPAYWKSVLIAAVVLLVLAGMIVVPFNLPVITGNVPR
jgi:hypothetical protein